MANVMPVRFSWQKPSVLPSPGGFFDVVMSGSAEYPHGRRGMWMSRCWLDARDNGANGMLCLDGDVAVEPVDVAEMGQAIEKCAESVYTTPVRLYLPEGGWHWAHGRNFYTQECVTKGINLFGFGFTYLPGSLLDACIMAGLEKWAFPSVNKRVSAIAQKNHHTVHLVPNIFPTHLHWT